MLPETDDNISVKISGSSTSRELKFFAVDENGEKTELLEQEKQTFN